MSEQLYTSEELYTPLWFMKILGFEPDPWQVEVLKTTHKRILLNCCRQAGKSTVVAVLALVEALTTPMHKVLILSRSLRQSRELFRNCLDFHKQLKGGLKYRKSAHELELTNFSRIVCLPCKEETIRGFAKVNLLIIDEAAIVPDDLYRAVRPMLAVSDGRLICLSTPHGKRGFFYKEWTEGGDDWLRIQIRADQVSRIQPKFLEQERRSLGEAFYRQEFFCSFEALEGLVYPDMARCVVAELPPYLAAVDAGRANQVMARSPDRAMSAVVEGRGDLRSRESAGSGDPRPTEAETAIWQDAYTVGNEWCEKRWLFDFAKAVDTSREYDEHEYKLGEMMDAWRDDRNASGNKYRKMPPWIAQQEGISPHDLRRLAKDPTLPVTPPLWPRGTRAVVGSHDAPPPAGETGSAGDLQWVGGIDFGFRNPFAAIWGVLDADGVLWLLGEHYQRQRPLSHHMQRLPRHVTWYADPSGAGEISELRQSDFMVRKGKNELRNGIAAVTARIETGGLKILQDRCPNLLHEAELYCYGDAAADKRAEAPVDDHNHALAALRYLVSRLEVWRGRREKGGAASLAS